MGSCLNQLVVTAGSGLTYRCLKLREGHLDGVEVRAVSRQVLKVCAAGGDGLFDASDFVGGEVVAYYQIARSQFGAEHLANVGQEEFAIHWPIDQPRSAEPIMAQGRNEGCRLPVAVRHLGQTSFADFRAPVETGHLGVQARLIEKDQPFCLPVSLAQPPALAGDLEVLPVLLGSA